MGIKIASITFSGIVTNIQDDTGSEVLFIVESKDKRGNLLTAMCKGYGNRIKDKLKQQQRLIVVGTPAAQNGALFIKAEAVYNPGEDFNFTTLGGYLGRDAETRQATNTSVTSSSLAVDTGSEKSSWFDWAYFRDLLSWMPEALRKGAAIVISGDLQANEYTPNQGKNAGKLVKKLSLITNQLNFLPRTMQNANENQNGYATNQKAQTNTDFSNVTPPKGWKTADQLTNGSSPAIPSQNDIPEDWNEIPF